MCLFSVAFNIGKSQYAKYRTMEIKKYAEVHIPLDDVQSIGVDGDYLSVVELGLPVERREGVAAHLQILGRNVLFSCSIIWQDQDRSVQEILS